MTIHSNGLSDAINAINASNKTLKERALSAALSYQQAQSSANPPNNAKLAAAQRLVRQVLRTQRGDAEIGEDRAQKILSQLQTWQAKLAENPNISKADLFALNHLRVQARLIGHRNVTEWLMLTNTLNSKPDDGQCWTGFDRASTRLGEMNNVLDQIDHQLSLSSRQSANVSAPPAGSAE